MTGYKNFLTQKELKIKMSSLLNVSNDAGSKPKGFSISDIEVLADKKEQNWFKRAHVGKFLGLVYIHRSTAKVADKDQKTRAFLKVEGGCHDATPPREDAQDHDILISLAGALYVVVNSQKDKRKALKKHIMKDIVQAIEEKDATIALLNDDIKNREYENVCLQGEINAKDQQIVALQRRCVGYEDKNSMHHSDVQMRIRTIASASSRRTMKKKSIGIYLYGDNMVIEDIRSGCC